MLNSDPAGEFAIGMKKRPRFAPPLSSEKALAYCKPGGIGVSGRTLVSVSELSRPFSLTAVMITPFAASLGLPKVTSISPRFAPVKLKFAVLPDATLTETAGRVSLSPRLEVLFWITSRLPNSMAGRPPVRQSAADEAAIKFLLMTQR